MADLKKAQHQNAQARVDSLTGAMTDPRQNRLNAGLWCLRRPFGSLCSLRTGLFVPVVSERSESNYFNGATIRCSRFQSTPRLVGEGNRFAAIV